MYFPYDVGVDEVEEVHSPIRFGGLHRQTDNSVIGLDLNVPRRVFVFLDFDFPSRFIRSPVSVFTSRSREQLFVSVLARIPVFSFLRRQGEVRTLFPCRNME